MTEMQVKHRVELTTLTFGGGLEDILRLISLERLNGNLIISFSYGKEVGTKFEQKKRLDNEL